MVTTLQLFYQLPKYQNTSQISSLVFSKTAPENCSLQRDTCVKQLQQAFNYNFLLLLNTNYNKCDLILLRTPGTRILQCSLFVLLYTGSLVWFFVYQRCYAASHLHHREDVIIIFSSLIKKSQSGTFHFLINTVLSCISFS